MSFFPLLHRGAPSRVGADRALPGRDHYAYPVPKFHAVLGAPIMGPFPADTEVAYFGMGCFWGAERKFWRMPGVYSTAVGYQGGHTPHPTYREVCTGMTGHAEMVQVVFCPDQTDYTQMLKMFWEHHDPTTADRQGNDVGTQYRSAIYTTTQRQADLARRSAALFGQVLAADGWGDVTTEIAPAQGREFFYAEEDHQQYLHKIPHGYQCATETGLQLPPLDEGPSTLHVV